MGKLDVAYCGDAYAVLEDREAIVAFPKKEMAYRYMSRVKKDNNREIKTSDYTINKL